MLWFQKISMLRSMEYGQSGKAIQNDGLTFFVHAFSGKAFAEAFPVLHSAWQGSHGGGSGGRIQEDDHSGQEGPVAAGRRQGDQS